MNNSIKIEHITKKYKDVIACNDISLSIEKGTLFGLLGVNGAGKTTLINILSGLIIPDSGEAFIEGYSINKEINDIQKIINVSTQETAIALNLTVKENLVFFANIYDIANKKEKIEEIINVFKLETVINKKAKTLSGGYQRRLSIAIALITSPKVLFLDEPTLGLDVLAKRSLWEIILKLKGKCTIVLTSHYLEEIEHLCDKVAILSSGKVLDIDTIENIKSKESEQTFENAFVKIIERNQTI